MSSSFVPRRSARLLCRGKRAAPAAVAVAVPTTRVFHNAKAVPVSPPSAAPTTPPQRTRAVPPDAPPREHQRRSTTAYPAHIPDVGYVDIGALVPHSELVVGNHYFVGNDKESAKYGTLVELGKLMAAMEFGDEELHGAPLYRTEFYEVDMFEPCCAVSVDKISIGDYIFVSPATGVRVLYANDSTNRAKQWFGRVTRIDTSAHTGATSITIANTRFESEPRDSRWHRCFFSCVKIRPVVPKPSEKYVTVVDELLKFIEHLTTHGETDIKNVLVIGILAYALLCAKPGQISGALYNVLKLKVGEVGAKFGEDDGRYKALRRYLDAIPKHA